MVCPNTIYWRYWWERQKLAKMALCEICNKVLIEKRIRDNGILLCCPDCVFAKRK